MGFLDMKKNTKKGIKMTDLSWVKLPKNIITDEILDYISAMLPKHLKFAPYMFMLAIYKKIDDMGSFDLEDGLIFSRMMKLDRPEDVFLVANLFLKRGIITRIKDTTCMLTDWEVIQKPNMKAPRTAEERREKIRQQIEAKTKDNSFDIFAEYQKQTSTDPIFFVSNNDKKGENVVNGFYDDKKGENVVNVKKEREIEREIETEREEFRQIEFREIEKKDTHTEREAPPSYSELSGAKEKQETTEEEIQEETEEILESVLQALDGVVVEGETENIKNERTERSGLVEKIEEVKTQVTDFFTKFDYAFNSTSQNGLLEQLASRIIELEDDYNSVKDITSVILSQFKKLTESDGYFKDYPLTLEGLLKPGAYTHVLAKASKILVTQKEQSQKWIEQFTRTQQDLQEIKIAKECRKFDETYSQYNISSDDPNRAAKLLQAKAAENTS